MLISRQSKVLAELFQKLAGTRGSVPRPAPQSAKHSQRSKSEGNQVIKVSENFEDFLAKCADFGILYEYNPDHKILCFASYSLTQRKKY